MPALAGHEQSLSGQVRRLIGGSVGHAPVFLIGAGVFELCLLSTAPRIAVSFGLRQRYCVPAIAVRALVSGVPGVKYFLLHE